MKTSQGERRSHEVVGSFDNFNHIPYRVLGGGQPSSTNGQEIKDLKTKIASLEIRIKVLESHAGSGDIENKIACLQRQIRCEINGLKLIKSGWDGGYSLQSQGLCSGCSSPYPWAE